MSTQWKVPRIWPNECVAILAGGPSMSQEIADAVRDKCRIIAVNDAYLLAPWADMLYAADAKWWDHHRDTALKFEGLKVSIGTIVRYPEVLSVFDGSESYNMRFGLDKRTSHIISCRNSGYQAMHIAVHGGASKIFLFGFDMKPVNGKSHWFGEHPKQIRNQDQSPYGAFIRLMTLSAPAFKNVGVEVFNCTQGSALKCFPFMTLEKALESMSANSRLTAISA